MIDSMGPDYCPTGGILQIPLLGVGYRQNFGMEPKRVLAENLRALMAAHPALDSLKKIVAASGGALSNGKLDRIRRATNSTDIATLGDLAHIFAVEPWQLLVPNLNPKALPRLDYADLLDRIQSLVSIPELKGSVTYLPSVGIRPIAENETPPKIPKTPRLGPALKQATKLPKKEAADHGDRQVTRRTSKPGRNSGS